MKLNSLVVRSLSGVVFFVVMISMIFISQYSLALILAVVAFGCQREFYKLSSLAGSKAQKCSGYLLMTLVYALNLLVVLGVFDYLALALLLPLLLLPFVVEMYRASEHPISNVSTTLTGLIYCCLAPICLLHLSVFWGDFFPGVIIGFMLLVWANDVGAYLVGMSIGKHRLFERLSPKKSWEGFFGGLICCIALGAYLVQFIDYTLWFGAGLGFIISVSGVAGDLIESMFKREVGVKDSGSFMPGHGGFLDRFDALLLSAPLTLIYFIIFT